MIAITTVVAIITVAVIAWQLLKRIVAASNFLPFTSVIFYPGNQPDPCRISGCSGQNRKLRFFILTAPSTFFIIPIKHDFAVLYCFLLIILIIIDK